MNKYKIYNDLILTSNCPNTADNFSKFIEIISSYKKNPAFILNIHVDSVCPMLFVGKALLYLTHHSYKLHDYVYKFYNIALEQAKSLELEEWEVNWLNILKYIIEEDEEKTKEYLLKNSKDSPNDLLNLRFGVFIGIVNADKQIMSDLLDNHSKYLPNEDNTCFLALKSFILEELKHYSKSEEVIIKGLKLDPNNIQLQHVYSHVMYYQNRVYESINFLEERKHLWEENSNSFLNKHIRWHLSISYLETCQFDKSLELIDEIIEKGFDDAECPLAILGYLLRIYLRTGNFYENHAEKVLEYLKNTEIFTKHYLFDIISFWLLSYTNKGLEEASKALNNLIKIGKRKFLKIHSEGFLNLINAMIHFGRHEYKECVNILEKEKEIANKLSGSDEQKQIIYEVELYCYAVLNEKYKFYKLLQSDIFEDNFKTFEFVKNLEKKFL